MRRTNPNIQVARPRTAFPTEAVSISELPAVPAENVNSSDVVVLNQTTGTQVINMGELKRFMLQELIGSIHIFTYDTLPENFLVCDGTEVNIEDYPVLYSKIGSTYGSSKDPSAFVLPDLQDRFIRGASATNHLAQAQDDALQNITGVVPALFDNRGTPSGAFAAGGGWNMPLNFDGGEHAGNNFTFDASRVARTATETRPKNLALVMAIRAR